MTTQSTTPCALLERFFDGELGVEEARAFRAHLHDCARCERELHQLTQLELLEGAMAGPPAQSAPPPGSLSFFRRRRAHVMALVSALAVAAGGVLLFRRAGQSPLDVLELAPTRGIDVRLSHPAAARHRPYDAPRAATPATRPVPYATLAALEKAGDRHGLAVAALISGDAEGAARMLAALPPGAATLADRGAALLVAGKADEALAALDEADLRAPGSRAVAWNRALALEALGLPLSAATSFAALAAGGEPGWSEEADLRARTLQAVTRGHAEWLRLAPPAAEAMAREGKLPALELLHAAPGLFRQRLLDALEAAPSRERALALGPAAAALDALVGGQSLGRLVERAAARDRAAVARLCAADPIRALAADRARARSAGDTATAERILRAADARCGVPSTAQVCTGLALEPSTAPVCAGLALDLGELLVATGRPAEAANALRSARLRARIEGPAALEARALERLAALARQLGASALARAYTAELQAARP